MLKSLTLFALLVLGALSSCEKIRHNIGRLGKKPPADAKSSHTGPLVTEIPKAICEMFPVSSRRIVIVDFYADWCGPCRMLSPMLEKIAGENPDTVFVCKVNVDKFREIAAQEGVQGIPDVRIFQDGKLVDKFVGAPSETVVRQRIEALTQHLPAPPPREAEAGKPKPKEPAIQPMTKDWLPPGIQRR